MCSLPARLLFIGLWCLADRKGLLEDRPLRIKGQVFPFDNIEVAPLLDELADHNFIHRYEAYGAKLLLIPRFLQHQSPHTNESDSILPEPTCYQGDKCLPPRRRTQQSENQRIRESENQDSEILQGECEGESSAESGDALGGLRPWLAMWNRLRADGFVAAGVDAESPSEAVRKAWKRAQDEREVRDLLVDPKPVEKAIRESSFCNAGWFTLAKLIHGKNKTGEWIIQRLLEGGYRDAESRRNGRQSAGKEYDPAAKGDL